MELNAMFTCMVLFSLFGLTIAECPNGWTVFDGSCYLFPQQDSNFIGANNHCSLLEGHLVNIGSQRENAFVKSFAAAEKDHLHWIGLNDIAIEGVWDWVDTGEAGAFTDWAPGQPDGASQQNCVILHPMHAFMWHDQDCHVSQHFICEKPLNEDTQIVG